MTRATLMARGLLVCGLGAVGTGCGSSGGDVVSSPDLDDVTLGDVQAQVFSPRCAIPECHVGNDAPFELDLSAGESEGNLVRVDSAELPTLLRVKPRDPADSYLYMKLSGDPRILGDPMPAEGPPLSGGELRLIEAWIDQGAN